MRRAERQLIAEYTALLRTQAAVLATDSYEQATLIASAAQIVGGYEEIKLASVHRYDDRLGARTPAS